MYIMSTKTKTIQCYVMYWLNGLMGRAGADEDVECLLEELRGLTLGWNYDTRRRFWPACRLPPLANFATYFQLPTLLHGGGPWYYASGYWIAETYGISRVFMNWLEHWWTTTFFPLWLLGIACTFEENGGALGLFYTSCVSLAL